jgi:hypothetical protein
MSWTLAHTFDIIKYLPKYIIKQKGEYYDLLMSLYNCVNIETKSITQKNIIDVLNDVFDDKNYYKKIDLQVYQLNKQIFDYPKQITTTIDDINSNVLFYYNFTTEKISLIQFIEYCKSIKTHKLVGISGFNHDQKPIFIKNRNNMFLVYESLHKCKILSNDIEIYPNMIYFKYKEKCSHSQLYKESYKKRESLDPVFTRQAVPVIVDNGNINDQLTNISIPLFYDVITKIYKVQYFDFQFQNEIKTFVNNFIIMCNKYITTQQVYHPKQYYLNRTKTSKKEKK